MVSSTKTDLQLTRTAVVFAPGILFLLFQSMKTIKNPTAKLLLCLRVLTLFCYQQTWCKSIYWSSDFQYNLTTGEQRQSQRFQVALPSDFFTSNQIYRIFRKSFPRSVVLVSPTVHFNFFKVGSNKRTSVYQPMAAKPLT